MASPRVFISFEMEDRWARDFLVQHARDARNDVEFVDYSVQNPWDSSWKTQCRERIGSTKGTIVLVGRTTYESEAVRWEIAETSRQGHYLFGIQIHKDGANRIPQGLPVASVIPWQFNTIVAWLSTWT